MAPTMYFFTTAKSLKLTPDAVTGKSLRTAGLHFGAKLKEFCALLQRACISPGIDLRRERESAAGRDLPKTQETCVCNSTCSPCGTPCSAFVSTTSKYPIYILFGAARPLCDVFSNLLFFV